MYYKDSGTVVNAALLQKVEADIDVVMSTSCNGLGVFAGIQCTSKSQQYGQALADLVRVVTLLTSNALMRGRLVERLVIIEMDY